MLRYLFYIVDVFGQEKYQGNQLAVVRNAEGLSDDRMQQIAREINFSETAFILSDESRDHGYDVRIFTPESEIPMAGHPALGTAFVIQHLINHESFGSVRLNFRGGPVTVDFDPDTSDSKLLWMTPPTPRFGEILTRKPAAKILSLDPEDIDDRFPVQVMSLGIPFIMIPLKTLDATDRARENPRDYPWTGAGINGPVFLFCPEPVDAGNHVHARMFASCLGVPEDPATGSAAACLAAYMVQHNYFGKSSIDIRMEQGYALHRRSLIHLRAEQKSSHMDIRVGGKVFLVAKGELL